MKLTDAIEVSRVKQVLIAGAKYSRHYVSEDYRRYFRETGIEKLTGEQMAKRVRKLIATGKWRLWVDGDTINLTPKVE